QRLVDEQSQLAVRISATAGQPLAGGATLAFPDGVFAVPVQPMATVGGLVSAIAEAIGFRFYSDVPARQQLLNFLQGKQLLLVLDNIEHLAESASLIAEVLARASGLKVLVTSQKPLDIPREWLHPLAGMRWTHTAERLGAVGYRPADEGEASADAVQLFVQSALRTQVDFAAEREQAHVVRICRLVDGMPLALELAAGWLTVLSCAQIADELERSLDLLTARPQNLPHHHDSLYAVLDQSWQFLTEAEQALLRRLAVFHGGFSQQAASEVANASLPRLASLVEKALLGVMPGGRYQMHELLRQFVQTQM
ncbi:MAG TPA: hypothetical protein PKE45_20535, partial [Caldilineaceae bacterium]|nr:hypothetical protein [Caldilineaceae bacterium]